MSQKSENIEPVSLDKLMKRERAKALLLLTMPKRNKGGGTDGGKGKKSRQH